MLVENDPSDPGGETFCGLDRRSHPHLDFAKATPESVTRVYLADYWNKYKCGEYPDKLGECVFNCVVNAGWGRAAKILANGGKTADKFLDEQEAFYGRLVAAKPSSGKYLKGWLNRTGALRALLK